MGVAEKMWDAITTVIKMNDKVERMAATMVNPVASNRLPTTAWLTFRRIRVGRGRGTRNRS